MKRIIFTFTFLVVLLIALNANARVFYTYDKQGGKIVFNWFRSYVGYYSVIPSITYDSKTGNVLKHTECKDPGDARCEFSPTTSGGQTIISSGCSFSTDFLENIVNDIILEIDGNIVDNGQYEGSISKKIQATSIEGNLCIIAFEANWINGDKDGNGKITISIDGIKI